MDSPLRRQRIAMRLFQWQLGERCGVRGHTIYRYEQGTRHPTPAILQRLMAVTGLSADAILFPERYLREHPDFLRDYAETPQAGRPCRR